ncbi:MAG: cyaB [Paenibacillaceae bacterium]|jgi:adenylate cyclase|nr:cyaB [Paenibacillaceae bacterium]
MKMKPELVSLVVLVAFVFFSFSNTFESLEYRLEDSVLQSSAKVDTAISILAIDEKSQDALGLWPWSRKLLAEAINKLAEGKAAIIGVDVILSQTTSDTLGDQALSEAISHAGNVVLPVAGWKGAEEKMAATSLSASSGLRLLESPSLEQPLESFRSNSAVGHITTVVDADNVVRRTLNSFLYQGKEIDSFAKTIYDQYMQMKPDYKEGDEASIRRGSLNRSRIAFAGAPGDFEHASFYQLLDGTIPPDYFAGKIVLIGPYATGMMDAYLTPLDKKVPMYGVEIHANIIQNYLNKEFKKEVPGFVNLAVLAAICLVLHVLFRRLGPLKSALVLLIFCAAYLYGAKWFYGQGYILLLIYPLLAAGFIYMGIIIWRYIEELLERKRVTDAFGKYVAPQVVRQILDNGEEGLKLGGVRREITVLFVDIRGFTPMSEQCTPEEVVAILNDYLNLCAQSIFQFGGTLDKFIGDATMAIFNAPLDLPQHELMAVKTAWAMKSGSVKLKQQLEERFGKSVEFGIGIHTGYAVVGNIGAKFRMDYTAIGDTVNTAARLESNAKPGQILLSQATCDRVKESIHASPLGEIKVKGKEQGIHVYQLDGIKQG